SASASIDAIDCLIVTVGTDEGISGCGYIYILGGNPLTPMRAVVDYLAACVVGLDPFETAAIWERMWRATAFIGPRGVPCFALAAIDTALWDIKGHVTGEPVHRLVGTFATRVPVYYSGLFLNSTLDELVREARDLVAAGWKALKMR